MSEEKSLTVAEQAELSGVIYAEVLAVLVKYNNRVPFSTIMGVLRLVEYGLVEEVNKQEEERRRGKEGA